jgi:BirA family biotin operon repressor/biotin-[acetyl-CoA-carboxylase] ligase
VSALDPSRPPLDDTALVESAGPRWRVEVVEASPSTNADVARRARDGEPAGLVVVAEHQSAGRGRLDRVWVTPPRAALTVSMLVEPGAVPPGRWPWLPLLTGLAVSEAVREVAGLEARLKWPNDVLVADSDEERKVAGVLVELVDRPGGTAAVVGVGLNVSSTREELPVGTATSLTLAGAEHPDRGALLLALLAAFARRFDGWSGQGGAGVRAPYAAVCSTLGREVRVALPEGRTLQGRAVDVDDDGRLLVDDGTRVHALGAGDVVHVRPTAG